MSDNRQFLKVQKIKEGQAEHYRKGINRIILKDENGITYSWITKTKLITAYPIGSWIEITAYISTWKTDEGYLSIRNVYWEYNRNTSCSVTYNYKY